MDTNKLLESSGETLEYARLYAEQKMERTKLDIAQRLAVTTSDLITGTVIAILAGMIVLFLSLALGFFLATLLGSYALAFFGVALLYGLATAAVIYFKRSIITNPVLSIILKNILD